TRLAPRARVAAVGSAARVGVGEADRCQAQREGAVVLALPVDLPVQGIEADARIGKDLRQIDLGLARGELEAAFLLARLERAAQAGEAGKAAPPTEAEVAEARAGGEALRAGEPALPFEARVVDAAGRLQLGEQRASV